MDHLCCVLAIILILWLVWSCACKKLESLKSGPPELPRNVGPQWTEQAPLVAFESPAAAQIFSNTLLRREGMESAGAADNNLQSRPGVTWGQYV